MWIQKKRVLYVEAVRIVEGHRVALRVQSDDEFLTFVYRAGRSIYWEPERQEFEDRFLLESSTLASFRRMRGAVREELGYELEPSPELEWIDVPAEDRSAIERWWIDASW